jgi:hypothetical protein
MTGNFDLLRWVWLVGWSFDQRRKDPSNTIRPNFQCTASIAADASSRTTGLHWPRLSRFRWKARSGPTPLRTSSKSGVPGRSRVHAERVSRQDSVNASRSPRKAGLGLESDYSAAILAPARADTRIGCPGSPGVGENSEEGEHGNE